MARAIDGTNVAVVPIPETVPGTGVTPGPVTVMVAVLIVSGFIASLKPMETVLLMGTSMSPLAGEVTLTVGDVVSGAAPVVKVDTKFVARAFPARSMTPGVTVTE